MLVCNAQAQEAAPAETVTVTATRIERTTLEIPAGIDRVEAEDIRFARAQVNLSESLGRVPGIAVQNRQNYAQDLQVSSRGFGTRSTFGIRGLRLLADGIPASMPDGQGQAANFDLGSAERIEVLRGPFSVMYGNASGGVINVLTESGADARGLSADAAAGSYAMRRAALKWGGKEDALDAIASASRFRIAGFREHSAARREQVNAKLKFEPGGATTATLVANALDSPETQDPLGLTRAQMTANPRGVDPAALAFDTRKSVRQSQTGASMSRRLTPTETLSGAAYVGQRDVRQYLALAGTLATSAGGVVDLDRGYGGASLRLASRTRLAERPLTLVLGGEHERMAERRQGFVNNNGVAGALKRDEDDVVTASGAFVQADWRFADEWLALAGLRTNRVAFRSTDYYVVGANPDDSGAKDYRQTTPVAGVVHRLAPATSLYANWGRGFESPTFAELAYRSGGATGLNFDLAASRSRHAEMGLKTLLDARTRLNAAFFDVGTRDEIIVDAAAGGRTTYKNAGRTLRQGVELGIDARLPMGFDAVFAWTWLDATFRDRTTNAAGTVPAGNVLPGIARQTLYAELRWRDPGSGLSAALEMLRRSRVAVNDANSEFADGYAAANLALALTQQGKDWRVSEYLRVDNLADARYVGSVIVNDGSNRYYEPAPGRSATVGVQAKLSF